MAVKPWVQEQSSKDILGMGVPCSPFHVLCQRQHSWEDVDAGVGVVEGHVHHAQDIWALATEVGLQLNPAGQLLHVLGDLLAARGCVAKEQDACSQEGTSDTGIRRGSVAAGTLEPPRLQQP